MCNCGKKTPPPPPPPPTQADKTSVVASGTLATQTFVLTTPTGRPQTFGSRLEADAARVRSGGVGTIVPGR